MGQVGQLVPYEPLKRKLVSVVCVCVGGGGGNLIRSYS